MITTASPRAQARVCRPSAGALGDLSDAGEDSSIVQVLANYAKSTYAGRRRGELLGLQIEDVDPRRRSIRPPAR